MSKMFNFTCCDRPHLSAEVEQCGCEITLCFVCGNERLVQPCAACADRIQREL